MKHVLNILLIYTLVFSPVVSADGQATTKGQQNAAALQQFMMNFQQQMAQQQAQMQCQQQTMKNQQLYMIKPLQDENFPQCKVLQARGNHMYDIHQCRQPDESNICNIKSFYEIAEQNANAFDNYLGDHTQKKSTGYGKTCLEKASENLGASYDKVIADLQEHLQSMKREKENLVAMLRPTLDNIKIKDALINGEEGENKKKLLKSTKFSKFFKDAACKTMIDPKTANEMGAGGNEANGGGGLRSIENMLEGRFTSGGKSSPQTILGEQSRIEKEIRDTVGTIADDMEAAGLNAAVGGQSKPTFSDTEYGVGTSKSLEAAVKESLRPHKNFIEQTQRKAQKYIGDNQQYASLVSKAYQTDIDMMEELRVFQKNFKDSCFANNSKGKLRRLDRIIRRLEDRKGRISKKKQRKADNPFKNKLTNIVNDNDLTIEDKLRQVIEEEKKGSGQNWVLRSGTTIPCGDSTITASGATKLSDIMSCYYQDCKQRFNFRRKGTKGYPPAAIAKLTNKIHEKVVAKEKSFKNDITESMLGRMIDCKGMETKAKGTNSCKDSGIYGISGPRFCMKQAVQCSANISGCMEKTKAKIDKLEKEKLTEALKYRGEVMRYKKKLMDRFDQIRGYVDAAAKNVQSIFPAASWFGDEDYKTDFGIDDFKNENKAALYPDANNIDPALQMEDPVKYFELMVKKVTNVMEKVLEHRKKALEQAEKERLTYLAQWAKDKAFWEGLKGKCMAAIDGVNQQIAARNQEKQKAYAERMKMIGDFCNNTETFNTFPDCEKLPDLYEKIQESAGAVGNDPKYTAKIKEWHIACNKHNNEAEAASKIVIRESDLRDHCPSDAKKTTNEDCYNANQCWAAQKKVDDHIANKDDYKKTNPDTTDSNPYDDQLNSLTNERKNYCDKSEVKSSIKRIQEIVAKQTKDNAIKTKHPFKDGLGEHETLAHTACQAPSNEQQPGKFIFETLNRGLAGTIESGAWGI